MDEYFSIKWVEQSVRMLDQRLLPEQIIYRDYTTVEGVAQAIKDMVIRGAPAIGAAAAYGMALSAGKSESSNVQILKQELYQAADLLFSSRPTASNLSWSIQRILNCIEDISSVKEIRDRIMVEAHQIAREDIESNRQMGNHASTLIPDQVNVIHHCNTGALATAGYGTALGVIRTAHEQGKHIHVFVDETRPRLQGSRLTAWELEQLGIPYTIIVDGASGYYMQKQQIDLCLVGCDRIAANGDVANKIGTYNLALAAYMHRVPFYVVGPTSTIDLKTSSGDEIIIEERDAREITHIGEALITLKGAKVTNPAFDVTPATYISAIITEKGIVHPPYVENLKNIVMD